MNSNLKINYKPIKENLPIIKEKLESGEKKESPEVQNIKAPKAAEITLSVEDFVKNMEKMDKTRQGSEKGGADYYALVTEFREKYNAIDFTVDSKDLPKRVRELIELAKQLVILAPDESIQKAWQRYVDNLEAFLETLLPKDDHKIIKDETEPSNPGKGDGVGLVSLQQEYEIYQEKRKDFLAKIEKYAEQGQFSHSGITAETLIGLANGLLSAIDRLVGILESNKNGVKGARQEIFDALSKVGLSIEK